MTLLEEHVGKHSCYSQGCRREECVTAHRVYEREAQRRRRRPDEQPPRPMASEETRREVVEHLRWLQAHGAGNRRIARVTGLTVATLREIRLEYRGRITQRTADVILAVGLHKIPPRRPGGPSVKKSV